MSSRRTACILAFLAALPIATYARYAYANPSKYPEFAQQSLPDNITPAFIHIEELVAELNSGVQPLIVDVRTEEEYSEVHILGAVSAPLGEFKSYLKSIPRDRPVVLY
ncbi:MAG TPA: rhodanese-like domain-containing protein [Candidatus Binatia bacterium]